MPTLSEVQIYEKDGLFHNMIKLSKIMNGRYAAISSGGDMNTNNVLSYLEANKNKYPVAVCTIPKSVITAPPGWEDFTFRMYFLCTTNYTGDNQIKQRDPGTGTSMHNERYDVNDMKIVCLNFMHALEQLQQMFRGNLFHFKDKAPYVLDRLVNQGNDKVAGCYISFMLKAPLQCEYTDIDLTGVDINTLITVPAHIPHFH